MSRATEMTRAQLALRAAQQAAETQLSHVFDEVTFRLRSEPCVCFVLTFGLYADYSPELDVAVRLASITMQGREVEHGHLIWGLEQELVTASSLESGKQAIATCVDLLKKSGIAFGLLAHVEGDLDIEIHTGQTDPDSRLQEVLHFLSDEILDL